MIEIIPRAALNELVIEETKRLGPNFIRYEAKVDEARVGGVALQYRPTKLEVILEALWLAPEYRKSGYGKSLCLQALCLPLPDNTQFIDSGYRCFSSLPTLLSKAGQGLCESLVLEGMATQLDNGIYEIFPPTPNGLRALDIESAVK